MYRVLADATMVLHFAFLVYVALGGFLAWRWPWTIVTHIAAVTWGVLIVAVNLICPLTGPEDYFRRKAGQEGLGEEGFIATYLTGVVYPEEQVGLVRFLVGVVVAISWIGFGIRMARRRAVRRAEGSFSAIESP